MAKKLKWRLTQNTGPSVSVIPRSRPPLWAAGIKLKTYIEGIIKNCGTCEVLVNHQGNQKKLPLLIVESEGPNLLGRDWLMKLKLDWHMVNQVQVKEELTTLMARHWHFLEWTRYHQWCSCQDCNRRRRQSKILSSTPSTNCTPFKGR